MPEQIKQVRFNLFKITFQKMSTQTNSIDGQTKLLQNDFTIQAQQNAGIITKNTINYFGRHQLIRLVAVADNKIIK